MDDILVSVIIPVKNEGIHIQNTIKSLQSVLTKIKFEIIVVDDASTDHSCEFLQNDKNSTIKLMKTKGVGSAMARNIGASAAKGQIYIFCDGHLKFEDYWMDKLIEPILAREADAVNPGIVDLMKPKNIGYGFTWNSRLEPKWNKKFTSFSPSPLLAGGCMAISKETFLAIGGFETGFIIWGREDEEISLKLWLFGFTCFIQPTVKVYHFFRPSNRPYSINWENVNYNLLRMAFSHFNENRIEKCKQLIEPADLLKVEKQLLESDVFSQRNRYLKMRKFDDDWFMSKFHIDF